MLLFVTGIICVLGSVGGLECSGSWLSFIVTLAIGITCIVRGIKRIKG